MKHLKRLLVFILVAVLVVTAFALIACDDKPTVDKLDVTLTLASNQMAVVVRNGDEFDVYPVTLGEHGSTATSGEGVLAYLEEQGELEIVWTESGYGKWINSIGGAVPTKSNQYVEVFTSVKGEMGTWAGVATYLIGDVTVSSAAVGISELTVSAGVILYFQVSTY